MKMQNLVPWQDVSANISDPSNSISTAGSLFQTAMGEFNNMIDRKKISETDKINNDIMAAEDPDKIREMLQGAKENNWADLNSINQTGVGRLDTLFSQNMETDKFDFTKDSEYWNRGFKEKELGQQMAIARMKEQGANARAMMRAEQAAAAAKAKGAKKDDYLFAASLDDEKTVDNVLKNLPPNIAISLKGNLDNASAIISDNPEMFKDVAQVTEDTLTGKLTVDPRARQNTKNALVSSILIRAAEDDPNGLVANIIKRDKKGNFTGFIETKDAGTLQLISGVKALADYQAGSLVNQQVSQNVEVASTVKNFNRNFAGVMGDENASTYNLLGEKAIELINIGRGKGDKMTSRDKYIFLRELEDAVRSSGDPTAALVAVANNYTNIPYEFQSSRKAFNVELSKLVNNANKYSDKPTKFESKTENQRRQYYRLKNALEVDQDTFRLTNFGSGNRPLAGTDLSDKISLAPDDGTLELLEQNARNNEIAVENFHKKQDEFNRRKNSFNASN